MGGRRYKNKGKSGADRFNVPFDCMGECKRGQKELGARYIGHSFRRKEAKKALELQKSLNDALGSGAGITMPSLLSIPMLIDPGSTTLELQKDVGGGTHTASPEYQPWRESLATLPDDVKADIEKVYEDQQRDTEDWVIPSSDEIPTWMWAVGGAGAAFVLYRMMKK